MKQDNKKDGFIGVIRYSWCQLSTKYVSKPRSNNNKSRTRSNQTKSNFEIQTYQNEPKFNGFYSRHYLPNSNLIMTSAVKDGTFGK